MAENETWTEFLEDFCKSDFWYNDSYYEKSTVPNFTPCFQYTVLTALPAVFLFILAPIFTLQLEWLTKKRELQPLPCSFLSTVKFLLTTLLFISSLVLFLHYFVSWNLGEGQVFFWYPLIRFQTSAYITHMQRRLNRLGQPSNGILFNSAFLLFVCTIPEARSWIERIIEHKLQEPYNSYTCIVFGIWYISLALYLLALCWADKRSKDESLTVLEQPELSHSFLNQICMFWTGTFLGAKGLRQRNDLIVMDKLKESLALFREWNKIWQPKLKRFGRLNSQKPSVSSTLFAMFKWELISVGWLRLLADLLQFIAPLVILLFIPLLESEEYRVWKAVSLAIILFVSQQIRYFILNYVSLVSNQVGIQVGTTLKTVVYKKTLRLTINSLESQNDQQLQTLITHDIKAIQRLFQKIHLFWSPIIQISLIFFLFYIILYITALPLIFFVILLIIANCCTSTTHFNKNSNHIRLINEILQGIRTIKLRVWEQPLSKLLNEYRESEAKYKIHQTFIHLLANGTSLFAPFSLILITICLTFSNRLPSVDIFIVLLLIYQLCTPLDELQKIISAYRKFRPSIENLQQFLLAEQVDRKNEEKIDSNERLDLTTYDIQIEGAYYSTDHQIPLPTLMDVNLSVKKGEMVVVVGEDLGQCRNFLLALIGELKKLDGLVGINKSIGYVSANPWIINSTIRENVQFYSDKNDRELYEKVVEICGLEEVLNDESNKLDADLDEILSQNHKTLVGLARAIYQQPQVYIFENILSQMTEPTSKMVFHRIIQTSLNNKTRLLLTNNLEYMHQSDLIIYINGPSLNSGTFTQLSTTDPAFEQFIRNLELHSDHQIDSFNLEPPLASTSKNVIKERVIKPQRVTWEDSYRRSLDEQDDRSPLLTDEYSNVQQFRIYWHFFRSLSMTPQLFGLFALPILIASIEILKNLWFVDWMENDWRSENLDGHFPLILRLAIFICSGILEVVIFVLALYLLTQTGSKLTSNIYGRFIQRIFDAPVGFFTPENKAQLTEIFNHDLPLFDGKIPDAIGILSMSAVYVLVIMVIKVVVNPMAFIFIIPLSVILACHMFVYLKTIRQLHRMKIISQKPIIEHFLQTYKGSSTIRSFNRSRNFGWQNDEFLNLMAKISENETFIEHWMKIRLFTITNWFIFLTFLSIILLHHFGFGLSTNWIALMLSLVLNLPQFIQIFNEQLKRLAVTTISTNKLRKMELIDFELNSTISFESPPTDWPNRGSIRFENLSTFKQSNDTFLRNINVEINSTQQTLVVGGDDSGKKGLIACLFRFIDPAGGQIFIDDFDIQKVSFKELRQRLAIIPENPIFFAESLRFNLDPIGQISDDRLWTVLKAVNLDTVISTKWSDSLSHKLDVDDDLTIRQKWLFDLARVLLRPSRIMVVEESVREIDQGTVIALFEVIRREFADSTILILSSQFKSTIHRDIPVLFLENGELKGYDLPHKLINEWIEQ